MINAAGAQLLNLPQNGDAKDPASSPNGQAIIFKYAQPNPRYDRDWGQLHLTITGGDNPEWSPR